MCVKNTENPQLRDAYAIVWEKAEDLKVKGTVFMITSIRPDIYTQNYEGNTEMSTVTNVINPNAAIDPLLKMSRQDDKAKEWMKSLSPEQLFNVMQMSTTMRADIMKAAPIYQTLSKLIKDGPAFKARLGIYADKYAPQIIELNKGIDEFYQEFLKKFKDLQPPTEVMNQVNTHTYKEMLQYLTEQNKLFNEIYRVRGTLPKKAQKAQKHVNELTEK